MKKIIHTDEEGYEQSSLSIRDIFKRLNFTTMVTIPRIVTHSRTVTNAQKVSSHHTKDKHLFLEQGQLLPLRGFLFFGQSPVEVFSLVL